MLVQGAQGDEVAVIVNDGAHPAWWYDALSQTELSMLPIARKAGLAACLGLGWTSSSAAADAVLTETIALLRHGEKPALGLGQLTCQGLNRALALPGVIENEFGKPDAIFAPDPAQSKEDQGRPYSYVRPLATIEPTAIAFGLPVDASVGFADLDGLLQKLESPTYRNALVIVAWEHFYIAQLSRLIVGKHGGDPGLVPDWPPDDYDSFYVVKLHEGAGSPGVTFERRHEHLDGQPTTCPGPATR